MILTGKAKEDFLLYKGCLKEELNDEIYYPKDTWLYTDIIEWFDSVGIVINVSGVIRNGICNFSFEIQENNTLNSIENYVFSSRQEATKQAIEKANEIYNNRFK